MHDAVLVGGVQAMRYLYPQAEDFPLRKGPEVNLRSRVRPEMYSVTK